MVLCSYRTEGGSHYGKALWFRAYCWQYMKQMGIKAQWVKPWTFTTKDSDFSNELQNILNEQFNPERSNAVWCSDITYIWTINGFVYLTSIMDLYSRKIIAWTLSNTGPNITRLLIWRTPQIFMLFLINQQIIRPISLLTHQIIFL